MRLKVKTVEMLEKIIKFFVGLGWVGVIGVLLIKLLSCMLGVCFI
jgi:hypothetical protein